MLHPEDDLQRAVCHLLDIYERQRKLKYFAVPNGGWRRKQEARRMKSLGVKPGVPDIVIMFPNGRLICMELKSIKGVMSYVQKEWAAWLNAHFFPTRTIRTVEEAQSFVDEQLRAA